MKTLLLTALVLTITFSVQAKSKTKLFNGKNLKGWNIVVKDNAATPESVVKVEDGVIKVSGKPQGYLRTKDVFTNYELHLEWRWTEEPSNSGVLIHTNGYDHWPNCIEAQLKNSNAGDIVFIGYGTSGTVADSKFINTTKRFSVSPKFEESNEKPDDEWNSYDIICKDDNIKIFVNGLLQNTASKLSHTGGSIGLQSEGGPIEFRNIYIKELEK